MCVGEYEYLNVPQHGNSVEEDLCKKNTCYSTICAEFNKRGKNRIREGDWRLSFVTIIVKGCWRGSQHLYGRCDRRVILCRTHSRPLTQFEQIFGWPRVVHRCVHKPGAGVGSARQRGSLTSWAEPSRAVSEARALLRTPLASLSALIRSVAPLGHAILTVHVQYCILLYCTYGTCWHARALVCFRLPCLLVHLNALSVPPIW